MIQSFQKFSQSRVAIVFLAIVALSFMVFFGGNSWFSQRDPHAVVAEVGSVSIGRFELAEKVQKQVQQIMAQTGESINREDLLKTGFPQMILGQIIQENLLDMEAENLGLTVSDEALRDTIQSIKAFQNEQGVFDRILFTQLLHSNGLSEDAFIAEIRKELLRNQLSQAVIAGAFLPEEMVERLFNAQYQHRQASCVTISPKDMKAPKAPAESTLEAFYKEYQKEFKTPELRTLTILMVDPAAFVPEISVTEEEIKTAYDMKGEGKKSLQEMKPQLTVEIQKEKSNEKAYEMIQALDDKIAGGATFEELASTASKGTALLKLDQLDKSGKDRLGAQSPNLPQSKELAQDIFQAAFGLDQNTESPFSQAKNGVFYTVRVDQITPASFQPFTEIKDRVLKAWTETEQIKAAKAKAEEYVKSFNRGDAKVSLMSLLPSLSLAESSPKVSNEVKNLVFSLHPQQAGMVWTSDGFVMAVLNTIIPPEQKMWDEKMASFKDALLKQYQSDLLQAYLNALKVQYPVKVNSKAMKALFS
jgi:peptidyl-prolyl cis-trans isomerase D